MIAVKAGDRLRLGARFVSLPINMNLLLRAQVREASGLAPRTLSTDLPILSGVDQTVLTTTGTEVEIPADGHVEAAWLEGVVPGTWMRGQLHVEAQLMRRGQLLETLIGGFPDQGRPVLWLEDPYDPPDNVRLSHRMSGSIQNEGVGGAHEYRVRTTVPGFSAPYALVNGQIHLVNGANRELRMSIRRQSDGRLVTPLRYRNPGISVGEYIPIPNQYMDNPSSVPAGSGKLTFDADVDELFATILNVGANEDSDFSLMVEMLQGLLNPVPILSAVGGAGATITIDTPTWSVRYGKAHE